MNICLIFVFFLLYLVDAKEQLIYGLFTSQCFKTFFIEYHFFNFICIKQLAVKAIGYAMIVGSFGLKIPQIIKLLKTGNVTGLDSLSFLFSAFGFLVTFSYNFANKYPFSSYGESIVIMVQDIFCLMLIYYFSKKISKIFVILPIILIFSLILVSGYVPLYILTILQSFNILNFIISKSLQSISLYKSKTAENVSFITWFLMFGGSSARIITTIAEAPDIVNLSGFLIGTLLNFLIVIQILYYNKYKKKIE